MSQYSEKYVALHTKKDAAAIARQNAEIALDEIELAISNAQYQAKQAERTLKNSEKNRDLSLLDEKFSPSTISNYLSLDSEVVDAQADLENANAVIEKLTALKAMFTEE